MKLTPDDLQHLAGHLGLLVGHVRRAPLPFLIAVMKERGYDEQALATLAKLHPAEAHKLVLWSQHQGHEEATAIVDCHRQRSGRTEPIA